jgi:hypothetical protein
MSNLFYPLLISAIIVAIYYYTVFSSEKIKKYSNIFYAFFISHLIIIYLWLFTVFYEALIDSPFDNPISILTRMIYYILSVYLTIMSQI